MKLLLFILLTLPFTAQAFDLIYSCKSKRSTGTYDYFEIDLNARTIELLSLYNNKITSKGIVYKNISFHSVPADTFRRTGPTLKITNEQGEKIFAIEETSAFGLVGSHYYDPKGPYVEPHMPCIPGKGVPPAHLPSFSSYSSDRSCDSQLAIYVHTHQHH